jgi:hypothetical protein
LKVKRAVRSPQSYLNQFACRCDKQGREPLPAIRGAGDYVKGGIMQIKRILAGTAFALLLGVPSAFAQDAKESPATFNERYPAEKGSTQTPAEPAQVNKEVNKEQDTTGSARAARRAQQTVTPPVHATRTARPRARVVVVRRSFLDAGTDVIPREERKFLDYAYPPLYQPYNVVTNIGGRVGWHNSPLPGPFFPTTN